MLLLSRRCCTDPCQTITRSGLAHVLAIQAMPEPEIAMRTPHTTPQQDTDEQAIDRSEDAKAELPEGDDINDRLSAETDVADSIDEASAHRFDDMPQDGPLNFDDGTDMGHPRGNTARGGGTWQAEGGDSGDIKPPAEVLSANNGPSDRPGRR